MSSFVNKTPTSNESEAENLIENEEDINSSTYIGDYSAVRKRTFSHCGSDTSSPSYVPTISTCQSDLSEDAPALLLFTEEEEEWLLRHPRATFTIGSVLAFMSGLAITVNNFITKGANLSFGEIVAVGGIIQSILMMITCKIQGVELTSRTWKEMVMLWLIGISGGLTIMCTFASIMFIPVSKSILEMRL